MLLETDDLTEARRGRRFLSLDGVTTALGGLRHLSPTEASTPSPGALPIPPMHA